MSSPAWLYPRPPPVTRARLRHAAPPGPVPAWSVSRTAWPRRPSGSIPPSPTPPTGRTAVGPGSHHRPQRPVRSRYRGAEWDGERAHIDHSSRDFGNADTIIFDFPWNDPGHYYYTDDGVSGQVSRDHQAAVPTGLTNDGQLAGTIDPDWCIAGGPFAWAPTASPPSPSRSSSMATPSPSPTSTECRRR